MGYRTVLFMIILSIVSSGDLMASARKPFISGLDMPVGMVYDSDGFLYIAEWGSARVAKYDRSGTRTIVSTDVGRPSGLAIDQAGNLFIASYDRGIVYILEPGSSPKPYATGFKTPAGLLWTDDYLLVANRDAGEIVKVDGEGNKEVLANGLRSPVGIVKFNDGRIIVSCLNGGIDLMESDGSVRTIHSGLMSPAPGMVADGAQAVIVADYGGTALSRISLTGKSKVMADGFRTPVGLVRTPDGQLIVADWGQRGAFLVKSD